MQPSDLPGRSDDDSRASTEVFFRVDGPATVRLTRCKLALGAPGRGRERVFEQAEISVGSAPDNDLVLDDDTVSRRHCRIVQEDTSYVICDLGSTNGTWVNKVRVREAFLPAACTIHLGKAELRFSAEGADVEIVPSESERLGAAIGRGVKMRELFTIVEKIAPTGTTVVIEGETGTGKEVIAKEIHRLSPRARAPFLVLDCGAVPPSLIESELFGHEKGSFTGAVAQRQGLFETAHGGTVFLDEIGELPLDLQPKLLRALEAREIRRVGGGRAIRVDVRIIAATNRELHKEVAAGRFREDLYYRLCVVRLHIPPLRERVEDLPLLVKHLLARLAANKLDDGREKIRAVTPRAMERLAAWRFPGNVRELVNVVERAVSLADGDVLDENDLPELLRGETARAAVTPPPPPPPSSREPPHMPDGDEAALGTFKEAKERIVAGFEREYLVALLQKTGGNISQAARDADIDRKYFRKLMRKHGLAGDDAGEGEGDEA